MNNENKVTLRFSPGQDNDLIDWLAGMNLPYGKKGEAIKDVLRYGLNRTPTAESANLDTGKLMADIRQMVETSIQTSLAAFIAANPVSKQEEMPSASTPKKPSINSDHW